jgi:hypothetical protein
MVEIKRCMYILHKIHTSITNSLDIWVFRMRIGAVSGFCLFLSKPPKEPNVQSEALRNLIAACIKSIQLCKYVGCMEFQLIVLQWCIPKFQEMLQAKPSLPLSTCALKLAFFTFLVLFFIQITFHTPFLVLWPLQKGIGICGMLLQANILFILSHLKTAILSNERTNCLLLVGQIYCWNVNVRRVYLG